MQPDSLYLVTDSHLLSSSAKSLASHVEGAILGGVNIVQLREKEADTARFIEQAREVLQVCRKHQVPLVINDRVDVALAIGADGVHIGQEDMSCVEARRLLGPDVFIGVSVNDLTETKRAVEDGADYVGIGAVYQTQTKALTKPTMGISGLQDIMKYLATVDRDVGTVAIGGLNMSNIERVMFGASTPQKRLGGVAVVSAIMSVPEPEMTACALKYCLKATPHHQQRQELAFRSSADQQILPEFIYKIREARPLIHHMTNNVVKNFSANVTIAIGGSPAMSEVHEEVTDFAHANNGFLLNMGMIPSDLQTSIFAVQENNRLGTPCLLDPVGSGGTTFRRKATRTYLDHGYFDVIKGNESEIRAASGLTSSQRGVDNVNTSKLQDRCDVTRDLALRWKNIVVMTGIEDIVSNGVQTVIVRTGHALLGEITGSGCSLGSTIISAVAASPHDKFSATVAAVAFYGLAAEDAAKKETVLGPGTFVPAFLDSLYTMSQSQSDGGTAWEGSDSRRMTEFA